MSYAARFTPKAAKQVEKLHLAVAKRILIFLQEKPGRPYSSRSLGKKLVNEEFWRYRVGDYRILMNLDNDQILVLIVEVAHRRGVYNKL